MAHEDRCDYCDEWGSCEWIDDLLESKRSVACKTCIEESSTLLVAPYESR